MIINNFFQDLWCASHINSCRGQLLFDAMAALWCVAATMAVAAAAAPPNRTYTIALTGSREYSVVANDRVRLGIASLAQTTLNISVFSASGALGEVQVEFRSDRRWLLWNSPRAVDVAIVTDSSSRDATARLVVSPTSSSNWCGGGIRSVSTQLVRPYLLPVSEALSQLSERLRASEEHASQLSEQLAKQRSRNAQLQAFYVSGACAQAAQLAAPGAARVLSASMLEEDRIASGITRQGRRWTSSL